MEASFLRETLKLGRYLLNDGLEVTGSAAESRALEKSTQVASRFLQR